MLADNTAHLATSARRRHELTRSKAIQALGGLKYTGAPVTFETIARNAAVSRSWLYPQPDLRTEIERLPQATRRSTEPTLPAVQRTSDPSLRRRQEAALARNRELAEDTLRLRRQLARALGDERAEARTRHTSASSGPC
ncbi:DUF6262 family protein [Streptomyces sp. NPDC016172]|uniref:DUF6262 family protein n=1 Tax=Streptomyces sp. NPDC016172 TaxID=3364964 RepID=UPI0036F5EC8E